MNNFNLKAVEKLVYRNCTDVEFFLIINTYLVNRPIKCSKTVITLINSFETFIKFIHSLER